MDKILCKWFMTGMKNVSLPFVIVVVSGFNSLNFKMAISNDCSQGSQSYTIFQDGH